MSPDRRHPQLVNVDDRHLEVPPGATSTTMDSVGYPDSRRVAHFCAVDPKPGVASGTAPPKNLHEGQPSANHYENGPLAGSKKEA